MTMIPNGTGVLVTTQHRGVFFGYIDGDADALPASVTLIRCRNCVLWSADMQGFLGLAVQGPSENCRIGPAASETTLYDVTSISPVAAEAVKRWEVAPWK